MDSFLPSFSTAAVAFSVWTSGEEADKDQNVVVLANLAKADFLGWCYSVPVLAFLLSVSKR